MSSEHDVDEGLRAARLELERLAVALAQADVTALEASQARMAEVVDEIALLTPADLTRHDGADRSADTVTELRWLIERCRLLRRTFLPSGDRTPGGHPLISYGPDGTTVTAPQSACTLEVTG